MSFQVWGKGFLTETVQKWEKESEMLRPLTNHLVHVRLGLVLSKLGGMWPPMTMSSKLGFLNWFGNGQQVYSWIHLEDVAQSIWFILQQNNPSKLYNLTSPNPVSQKEIMQIASKVFTSVFIVWHPQISCSSCTIWHV